MTLDTESDPYKLRRILPVPVQQIYSSDEWYNNICQQYGNILNWMVIVRDNIDNNENTVTLPDDTVLRYTGGCILHDVEYKNRIRILYSYLAVRFTDSTLIITDKSMIKRWVNTNTSKFKLIDMKRYPIYSLHDLKYHNKITSANIIVTTTDIFTEMINPSPNLSDYKRFVLSVLRNKNWHNLVIDTFVSSELVNNISATCNWVMMSTASLSHKNVQNMMNIIFPHQYELYTNNYSYILPSVVMNITSDIDAELPYNIRLNFKYVSPPVPLKTLDPLQNSKCSLRYVINPNENNIDAQVNNYINAICNYPCFPFKKGILCVNDTNHIEKLYNKAKMHINATLLNKRVITVKDINEFKNSNSELLIIPRKNRFELGVDLLFISRLFIIYQGGSPQPDEYLTGYFRQKTLKCTTLWVVKFT